ncbi:hypothetical protein I79_015359 [Cricetulus griseus]|uniref:Uncharacterized protein n=1 Tax=Cricetulus griseus TaxID=10029 RepID=G3HWH6_CRIGR|nr:hypothetical protein I79_015359 [Cricetulus griseus]
MWASALLGSSPSGHLFEVHSCTAPEPMDQVSEGSRAGAGTWLGRLPAAVLPGALACQCEYRAPDLTPSFLSPSAREHLCSPCPSPAGGQRTCRG